MSDKTGGKAVQPEQRVFKPAEAIARPASRQHESQIEVTESALSDTAIERIFMRP